MDVKGADNRIFQQLYDILVGSAYVYNKYKDHISAGQYKDKEFGNERAEFDSAEQSLVSDRIEPLDAMLRNEFERLLGSDFSDVRIHTGPKAHRESEGLGARAFTQGSDIAFADGEYAPHTEEGQKLLAHELTHVIQQKQGIPLVFLEDIDEAEIAAEKAEELLAGKQLHDMENLGLTENDYSLNNGTYMKDTSGPAQTKQRSAGQGQGSLSDYSAQGGRLSYVITGKDGTETIVSAKEYVQIIQYAKKELMHWIDDELSLATKEEKELLLLKIKSWIDRRIYV